MIAGMAETGARGLLLVMDTSGGEGSVAVVEAGRVAGWRVMPGRSASERLLAEVRGLLGEAGFGLGDLTAIAVVLGPGSFTGIRIGVAAAKGLAEGLGVPVMGVSRLAVMAAWTRDRGEAGDVVALVDAGRGEMFAGRYGADGRLGTESLLTREAAMELCEGARVVATEEAVVEAMRPVEVQLIGPMDARAVVGMAIERMRAGAFDDVATLDAHYLRSTAAEIAAKAAGRG